MNNLKIGKYTKIMYIKDLNLMKSSLIFAIFSIQSKNNVIKETAKSYKYKHQKEKQYFKISRDFKIKLTIILVSQFN
jgi:hypothetical protein